MKDFSPSGTSYEGAPGSSRRDSFTERTKVLLSRRAGGLCCHPRCQASTTGPHTDPEKWVSIGIAAHITAASTGGPRFDPTLSPEQRRSPENGIWLCNNHANEVDSDELRFTTEMLRQWKAEGERRAGSILGVAAVIPAFHRIDCTARNVLLARYNRGGHPRNCRIGIVLYCIALANTSSQPITPKTLKLIYTRGGRIHEGQARIHETEAHNLSTSQITRSTGKVTPTIVLRTEEAAVVIFDWRNIREELSEARILQPGGVILGSAFFILDLYEVNELSSVHDAILQLDDYSGGRTEHRLALPELAEPEPWLVDRPFTLDATGQVQWLD